MTRRDVQGRGAAVLPLVALLAALSACSGGGSDSGGTDPADPLAPHGLAYSSNPVEYVQNVPISPNMPSTTSGDAVKSYAATLPLGLSIDKNTGVISGTPTVASTQPQSYTVTATNDHGTATVQLVISVKASTGYAISGLFYGKLPEYGTVQVVKSGGATLGTARADQGGRWAVTGASNGSTYDVFASGVSSFRAFPTKQTVTVASQNITDMVFYLGDASKDAAVCRGVASSPTVQIGTTSNYTADVVVWAQKGMLDLKASVRQGQTMGTAYQWAYLTPSGTLPAHFSQSGKFEVDSYFQPGTATVTLQLINDGTGEVYGNTSFDITLTK